MKTGVFLCPAFEVGRVPQGARYLTNCLAQERGFPIRNLCADATALEAAGFPLRNEDGRYFLDPSWRAPVANGVDADELRLVAARSLVTAEDR